MIIRYLELENFKCFKGQTIVPFVSGFTAIVGPNGAGKTSLLDSIKFVCGEVENNSNLINSDSSKTRVRIAFDKKFISVEKGKGLTSVEKILEKENKVSYYMNGKFASEEEILKVLKDLNLTIIDDCGVKLPPKECREYAKELKEKSKNEQVIVVSLRKEIMEAADNILGVKTSI